MSGVPSICYKTKEPHYYNKGTQWEKSCDEFLAFQQSWMDEKEAIEFCRKMNRSEGWGDLPKYYTGVDWDEVKYIFPGLSAEMIG